MWGAVSQYSNISGDTQLSPLWGAVSQYNSNMKWWMDFMVKINWLNGQTAVYRGLWLLQQPEAIVYKIIICWNSQLEKY